MYQTKKCFSVVVFPEDRHIFAYDGCIASVQRSRYTELVHKKSQLYTSLEPIVRGMCRDPVKVTTPLPSNTPLCFDVSLGGTGGALECSLAQVPVHQARSVETWISSVDTYFKLKAEEDNNGYLPFCLKLGFLVNNPVGNFEQGTDSYWCLNSILQYVTGCQGKSVPEGVLDAAKEWIKDYNVAHKAETTRIEALVLLSEYEKSMIENCCFQHKQILIGNKTLQDTVLPKEHWTMKQSSRNGCACCGPDPYELEEEGESETSENTTPSSSNLGLGSINVAIASNHELSTKKLRGGYVDATKVFAFDPTRFS